MGDLIRMLRENSYPGRGILVGREPLFDRTIVFYFLTGRSENSRNRIFEKTEDGIRTRAYDESKMTDPSLIIYRPLRHTGGKWIITNGDQTDTIRDFLQEGKTFREALMTRTYEPDAPNDTPRISALIHEDGTFETAILKRGAGEECLRIFNTYLPKAGYGRYFHTYEGDGNPLPSFEGEPREVTIPDDLDVFEEEVWRALSPEHKVSLMTLILKKDGTLEGLRLRNRKEEL